MRPSEDSPLIRGKIALVLRKLTTFSLRLVFTAAVIFIILLVAARWYTENYTRQRLHTIENAPTSQVAIVFGAGLMRDGSPTPVLRDRVVTGAELYFAGKVQKLLMSGDNRFDYYNEPGAMAEYATLLGVPEEDIVLDYAGRRTYDTCYRARHIFGIEDAILVTQRYHLPRAIYTCNTLGLEADGTPADRRRYLPVAYTRWLVREIGANLVALWELWVTRPLPVLGQPEPIFPEGLEETQTGGRIKPGLPLLPDPFMAFFLQYTPRHNLLEVEWIARKPWKLSIPM
jgi:SanA protein